MITKQALLDHIKTTATLLAIHGANPFQIQHYQQAALALEKTIPEDYIYLESLLSIDKNHRSFIEQILQHGTLPRYDELMPQTPEGIWELLKIPGLGPPKGTDSMASIRHYFPRTADSCLSNRASSNFEGIWP